MTLKNIFNPAFTVFLAIVSITFALPYIQAEEPVQMPTEIGDTPSIEPTELTELTATNIPKTIVKPTVTSKPKPAPTKKPQQFRCIVTINGHQYDVTALRRTHSGGNVFICGTNMTTTFNQQHGTNYGLIRPYLIN